jgi:Uma2 family endonuclease
LFYQKESRPITKVFMTAITLNLEAITHLTHEQFYKLCMANTDVAIERSAAGELIIVSSTGSLSGRREADYITDLGLWNPQTGLGKVFSSSTIFSLPDGGDRSLDAAWVKLERSESLSPDQQEKFPPLCPDFVIELRSRTDRLKPLQQKMQEYLNSGLQLGWLINPQDCQVEIYRPHYAVEVLSNPSTLSGESILPVFLLTMNLLLKKKGKIALSYTEISLVRESYDAS